VITIIKSKAPDIVNIDGAKAYQDILPRLYGKKSTSEKFEEELEYLLNVVSKEKKFDKYYNNKKEGFYQNILSRKYGICGTKNDNFVIIDKEAVVGYSDQAEKNKLFGNMQQKYKQLQQDISDLNPVRYGKNLGKKAIGNELDFLALDKEGNILLIEYKHGTNTAGIYLSPLQIGLYNDIFTSYPKNELEDAVFDMLKQKQEIGLINSNWPKPNRIKNIIPVLIISEYHYKSSAKTKFDEILQFTRTKLGSEFLKNLQTFNFTMTNGMLHW